MSVSLVSGRRPRVYLAGPDVFLPNAKAVGAEKVRLCDDAGLQGCFPLDTPVQLDGLTKHQQARAIFQVCEAMMRSCDLAVANCTPFRGASMDSGTAYEIGFMRALGRPVFGYSNTPMLYAGRAEAHRAGDRQTFDYDRADVEIENFDLAENLMIAVAADESGLPVVVPTSGATVDTADLQVFRHCLALVKRHLAAA